MKKYSIFSLVGIVCLFSFRNISEEKPNIVVIMADDIRLGDIGFYHKERTGQTPVVPTPNLDRLIAQGMRFSDAHSPASLCAPTRYSMITGNFSYRNYRSWGVWSPVMPTGIKKEEISIARIAKKGGYSTAFFGKWGLGGLWKGWPEDYAKTDETVQELGFDYSLVLPQGIQNKPYAFYESGQWMKLKKDSKLINIPFEQTRYKENWRNRNRDGIGDSNWDPALAGPMLANKAVAYIHQQAKRSEPFYMYYCSQAVHVPHTPSDSLNNTEIAGTTPGKHGDMIKELDAQVGMILKALEENGQDQNTLIVFTSDNGGLNLDKDMRLSGHDASNGFRAFKGSIYEGGHRVPFVAVWPGRIKADTESKVTIAGLDMVATLAAVVGVAVDPNQIQDTANLLPVFTRAAKAPLHKYLLHQSQSAGGPYYALREGEWKLILKAKSRRNFEGIKAIGLYNLDKDPFEKEENNLVESPEYRELKEEMTLKFLGLRNGGGATIY